MKVIHETAELKAGSRKVCAAIGVFDGVHLGHQQVIRQTISDARQHEAVALIITFDRHPQSVLAPARAPHLIYSLPQKLRVIEQLGADAAWVISFDRAFSEIGAEDFIRTLARDFRQLRSICVGSNFTFGNKRSGNVDLLKRLGAELGFQVHGLAAVSLDNQSVSSTRIREAIQSGNLDDASQMLGREYSLSGQVLRGEQVGHQLGFPTANLDVTGLVLPPGGVYAVHAGCEGKSWRAVMNLGTRPTVAKTGGAMQAEVHLLHFSGELYGKELDVTFVEKIREERKFPSLDALREQIERDIRTAEGLF